MHARWFNTTVVMLWLATMSWLVKEKILPPLLIGDPPSYSSIIEAQQSTPQVGWRISFNGRPVGWAISSTNAQATEVAEIRNRVHFDSLPLKDMMPTWLQAFAPLLRQPIDGLQMDARNTLVIDPLGHLVRFDSRVQVIPFAEAIELKGTVEGRQIQLVVRTGGTSFTSEAYLPCDALLCDAFSPQTQLPGLRIGQTWTVPVFSPLTLGKSPLEIVHATVESMQPILWNGEMRDCWLVVYRSDTRGAPGGQASRGILWVSRDGTVLKQQVLLFCSTIVFDRLNDDESKELIEKEGGRRWWWRPRGTWGYGNGRSRRPHD